MVTVRSVNGALETEQFPLQFSFAVDIQNEMLNAKFANGDRGLLKCMPHFYDLFMETKGREKKENTTNDISAKVI